MTDTKADKDFINRWTPYSSDLLPVDWLGQLLPTYEPSEEEKKALEELTQNQRRFCYKAQSKRLPLTALPNGGSLEVDPLALYQSIGRLGRKNPNYSLDAIMQQPLDKGDPDDYAAFVKGIHVMNATRLKPLARWIFADPKSEQNSEGEDQ